MRSVYHRNESLPIPAVTTRDLSAAIRQQQQGNCSPFSDCRTFLALDDSVQFGDADRSRFLWSLLHGHTSAVRL